MGRRGAVGAHLLILVRVTIWSHESDLKFISGLGPRDLVPTLHQPTSSPTTAQLGRASSANKIS
jgi:hypothetical protein